MSSRVFAWLAAATLLFAPGAALAAHGKAGLWSSATTVVIQGMPPQTQATTYCMTQKQVESNAPPGESPGCSYSNVQASGGTYTADMVCTGEFKATGHFSSTYDRDTHYTATVTIDAAGTKMTNTVDGKWVKADCAGAEH
jgi:hypothetical protein